MARKNYTVEQIIVKLREVELHCNQGKTIAEACRELGITEQTYYRWRKEYGGMNTSDARRMNIAKTAQNGRLCLFNSLFEGIFINLLTYYQTAFS